MDAVSDESNTGNNCRATTLTFTDPPDLVVDSPTVDPNSPETAAPGETLKLTATARNQGEGASGSTRLVAYRSTDETITTTDTPVGTENIGGLAASETITKVIWVTAPSTAGTYYYGVCVAAVSNESDTGNNCSSAVTVTVVPTAPDLVVGSPTASDNSPAAGASFTLSATVRNQGNGASGSTTLRYYRSTDASISSSDTEVGTDAVGGLSASATSAESISLTAPSAGTYYYGACVDAVTGESATGNNCSSAVTVTVTPGVPDLAVDAPTVSDNSLVVGSSFTLSATVRNRGSGASGSTTLRWYRSTDTSISSSDTEVGTDAVGGLSASGSSDQSISVTAPSVGTSNSRRYYYGACVEAVTGESDTGNNCSSWVGVTVYRATPDLAVDAPSVSDSNPVAGASFTFSATVRNRGSAASSSTTLFYFRSTDPDNWPNNTQLNETSQVSGLAPSETNNLSVSLRAPSSPGTYYYRAYVGRVSGESAISNNYSSAVQVTVTPGVPDLAVDAPSVTNGNPTAGSSFTLSATVRNRGDGASGSTTLRYYRSTDASISTSDTEVGTDAVGGLSASGTSAESISLTAPSAGTYYYGACVEAVTGESDTGNNCSSSVAVTVSPVPTAPDLVVGSPTASDNSPVAGGSFTLSATVRNRGDGASGSTTLRYYRSTDASISTSDTEVGTDAVGGLSASATSAESISLTAPSAGTYYYGACVAAVTGESDTGNNCSSSVQVTVSPPPPDLVVGSPTVSDNSPVAGASFTLRATVRNRGSGASGSTTLRYYRSTDASISTSDTEVGTDAVSGLSASATSAESISLTAPSAGTYYYGACVEAVTGESDTGNNCSSSVQVTVSPVPTTPDLAVDAPSVTNSNPVAGASFTLSATVRNRGDGASGSTTLRYYRSTDASISSSDTEVGTDAVSGLSASGTSAESISLTAPSAGTYYYGACVAAVTGESDTGNNCSSSVQVTVSPPPPDLVVGSPTVSDNSPVAGASFTLRATVRNRGSGASGSTTLRYYRSTDASISSSDTEVGTDAVSGLSASATSAESISLTAPSSGTYYYGACVEAVTGESDTGNNCSSSVQVTVSPVPTAPDLAVDAPSVTNSNPTAGASFTLRATVRNRGDGASGSTTLRYYRSTDASISSSDTEVGTDAVSGLSASGTSAESISLTAPSAGTYYYGACVAAVTGESATGNNCSSSVQVTVSPVPTTPDLAVDAPSVTNSNPVAGASFTLRATVRNRGSGASGSTTLRYYRSTDASISTSDTEVGTDPVSGLSASATSAESISLTAPSAGTYYYGACVEAVTGESDTGNNCSSSVQVTVSPVPTTPDLAVDAPSVTNSNPVAGASFTLRATVRNRGDGASGSTTLRYYRSTDASISSSDTEVGTDAVGGLSASGTSAESISLTAPSAGTYYYGACVEAVTGESATGNNCSSSVQVTVSPVPTTPDLAVDAPSVTNSNPVAGASFTLRATVRNRGDGASGSTTLRYYRSTNATISSSDTEVGTDPVGGLSASATSAESISLTAPSAGTYYYGACVAAVTGESDTGNNCSSSVTVTVSPVPTAPDLAVDAPSVTNGNPTAGASFTLRATVRNRGNGASGSTTLRYYRSTNATISSSDTEVGTDAVGGLAASATSDESIDLTAPSTGTYYYGACVEAVTGESDTGNNCSSSVAVTVSPVPTTAPDLAVDAPSVTNSNPTAGASFTLRATVRNRGSGASGSTTLRYYRSTNATISTSDTEVGTDQVNGLSASGSSAESISLTAPSAGTYYYGACVAAVTGESATGNNCSSSVRVTVSPVPTAPDLVVGSPTASDNSPAAGASFTLSATVRNRGDGASGSTTLRYYRSTDATISTSDTEVGTDAVGGLSASGTSAESISLTAPSAGTYYYGACVEAVTGESATGNNCSSSVQVTVSPVPTAPDLVATDAQNRIDLTWSAPSSNGGSAITAYDLRYIRSDAPDKADANWTVVEDVWSTGSGALTYELTGLSGGTQYDVQVRAVNGSGDGPWSATATGTPEPETQPTDFDGDGKTDLVDFLRFVDAYGGTDAHFDLDGNGTVDFVDFFKFVDAFGS